MGNIPEKCKCPKLFEELDKRDMKQNDFATLIGASTGNVSDWASGKSSPSRRRWAKISEVLGIPVEELMGTKKEPAGEGELTEDMKEILEYAQKMGPEERKAFITLLKSNSKK
nr:MAG TPA: Helix-turn-helix XRE-family like protein [Caudoviricetes sp.]